MAHLLLHPNVMRLPFSASLVLLLLGLPDVATARTPEQAEVILQVFDAEKEGAFRVSRRDEMQDQMQNASFAARLIRRQPLEPSVLRAAGGVLSGWVQPRQGWAARRSVKAQDGYGGIQVETTTGGLWIGESRRARWVDVRFKNLPGHAGATLWGTAHVRGLGSLSTRGRQWKVDRVERDIVALPEQAALWDHLEKRAATLLGSCQGKACAPQANRDLEWTRQTLRQARTAGIAPQPEEVPHGIRWRVELRDGQGYLRRLVVEDIALPPIRGVVKAGPLSVMGSETRSGARGVVRREFSRAHFDYDRRVRVVRPRR